jgi:hypothetical protein
MAAPDNDFPPFLEAHPPLMENADTFPPERTQYQVVGEPLLVKGGDMDRIKDPLFPWQDYAENHSTAYRNKVKKMVSDRNAAVDRYIVTRRRYWARLERYQFAVNTNQVITVHHGIIHHQGTTTEHNLSVTDRIAIGLGIDLTSEPSQLPSGELPPIPVPPIAAAATDGGGGQSTSMKGSFDFSHEVTTSLHVTETDETTYTDETTTTTTQDFIGGTTYIHWQLREECIVERVRKATGEPEPFSKVTAGSKVDHTDFFPRTRDDGGSIR